MRRPRLTAPIRIGLVSPLFESVPPRYYGGTERVVHLLCEGLARAGAEVTLFASADSTSPGRMVPVTERAIRLREMPAREPHAYSIKMLKEVGERAHEFDVIHNHNDFWMLPLSEMVTAPLVTTLHGRLDIPEVGEALHAYRRARFISISDSQRAPLPGLRWLGTVHHGLDLCRYRFHPEPGRYLAFLGRIAPEKRPDLAIEIAWHSGVPLKIAAKIEDGANKEYFETRVRPRIDGRFIEYVGEIGEAEKSDFLGNALALVFPIDWPEPFGLVMIEALAVGTPVLARPRGAVSEILAHGRTGYIEEQPADLAARVAEVGRLSRRACRAEAEMRFSSGRMVAEYLRLLNAERLDFHLPVAAAK